MKWKRSLAALLAALSLLLPACSNRDVPDDPPDTSQPSQGVDLKEWREQKLAESGVDQAEPDEDADTEDDDEDSETVYITKTGEKYHRSGCQYLSQSKIPISLSKAKKDYDTCSKCDPPQ